MFYTFGLHNFICQLHLNNARKRNPADFSPYSQVASFHAIVSFQRWPLNPKPSSLLVSSFHNHTTLYSVWLLAQSNLALLTIYWFYLKGHRWLVIIYKAKHIADT